MGKKKWTPFAVGKDDKLYVDVKAVMSPLVPLIDGLALTSFGREKRMYLFLDDAIAWCEKEKEYHSRERYESLIAAMQTFKANFAAGKLIEQ